MSLTKEFNEIISEWFDSIVYPSAPASLYLPIEYTLSAGGKRIRPTLLLAATKAFGGDMAKVKNQCVGIEMFHNFTLLHDDVMDNSDMRRGIPTVHRKWDSNTAILSGDTMLTWATQLISDCDDRHLRTVLDTFNRTAIQIYEGQQYDMDFENRNDVNVEEYLNMIKLKTSVLLGCALKIGAVLADAPAGAVEALYNYGIKLGMAFQLRDDYLDTFGNPIVFGKKIGNDILNDKKSWLMITALAEDQSGTMQQALRGLYADNEKINKVTAIYRELWLDKRILSLIRDYTEDAIEIVKSINMDNSLREYFIELALSAVERMN